MAEARVTSLRSRELVCSSVISVNITYITEDTPTVITGVSVGDIDEADSAYSQSSAILVIVTCNHGNVSTPAARVSGVQALPSASGQSLRLVGTLSGINAALTSLLYAPLGTTTGPTTCLSTRVTVRTARDTRAPTRHCLCTSTR